MRDLVPNKVYQSETVKKKTPCGNLFLTVVHEDGAFLPIKVFLTLGKAGGCAKAQLTVLSEFINSALEHGEADTIIALSKVTGFKCSEGDSCGHIAVRYILSKLIDKEQDDE